MSSCYFTVYEKKWATQSPCHGHFARFGICQSERLSHAKSGARFSKVPKVFGCSSSDIILSVSSKQRRHEARNFAVIWILFPLQHMKRPASQNKRVGVLWMAFRARKAFGTFQKRALYRVWPLKQRRSTSSVQLSCSNAWVNSSWAQPTPTSATAGHLPALLVSGG